MIIEFLPEAKAELLDAVAYYEGELPGLGQRFWDEIDHHIEWIAENPRVPRLRAGGYRRVNLSVFPYYLAYIIRIQSFGFYPSRTAAAFPNIGSTDLSVRAPSRGPWTVWLPCSIPSRIWILW